jgi:FlaA1/EpsC-like NDP-sugar epimerase
LDIAKAIDSKNKISFVGLRPGEKIHEELISKNDNDIIFDV